MSTAAWMPLYWGDYLRDTAHLSAAEHGAYLLLIGHYWTSAAALPDDDEKLRRIARMERAQWKQARPTLAAFFVVDNGVWTHARVESELVLWTNKKDGHVERARHAAAKRWASRKDAPSMPDALPNQCPSPSPSESSLRSDSESVPEKNHGRATRLPTHWRPDAEGLAFAAQLGLDPADTADRFRDYWIAQPGQKGVKLDWDSTWRNWCRTESDRRQAAASGPQRGGSSSGSVVAAASALMSASRNPHKL